MLSRRLLALSCAGPLWLLPATALAQDVAAADALFNKAVSDMDAGRYDAACPALVESQRLDPRPGTLFTIAACHGKAGKIATAATYYDDYLRASGDLPAAARTKHAERIKLARAELDKIRPLVPTLKLVLPAAVQASIARVRRDGTDLSVASLSVALPIDPGAHVVTLEVPGRAPSEQRFTVEKGQHKVLELAVGTEAARAGAPPAVGAPGPVVGPAVPPPAAEDPGRGRRIGAYVAGGAGAALVLVGGVAGGLALKQKSTVDANCKNLVCNHTGEAAVSAGKTLGTVSTVGFALGGAALVTGVVLLVTAPRAPKAVEKAARWDGGFIAGPGGVSASLKGAF